MPPKPRTTTTTTISRGFESWLSLDLTPGVTRVARREYLGRNSFPGEGGHLARRARHLAWHIRAHGASRPNPDVLGKND
jgi:hypothetical protein